MKIKIVKLDERAVVPNAGTGHSAGYDLCACMKEERTVIAPHTTKLIGTGLAAAIPEGDLGGIFARSGLSLKQGLRPRGDLRFAAQRFRYGADHRAGRTHRPAADPSLCEG